MYEIRLKSQQLIRTDTLFKAYKNTKLNIIPFIYKGKKKAYVVTISQKSGVVSLGNDYLINFDQKNNIIDKKQLHKNIIPIEYKKNSKEGNAIHLHTEDVGNFMTVTDVSTLLLLWEDTPWETHMVVSKNYLSVLHFRGNKLISMTMEAYEKMIKRIDEGMEKKKTN